MSTPQTAREIMFHLPNRFVGESSGDNGIFHFILEGDNGGEFTVKVESGACTVNEGLEGDPDCVIRSTASDFEDAELGRVNKQMSVMMGKIKISNLGAMMKFMTMFRDLETA